MADSETFDTVDAFMADRRDKREAAAAEVTDQGGADDSAEEEIFIYDAADGADESDNGGKEIIDDSPIVDDAEDDLGDDGEAIDDGDSDDLGDDEGEGEGEDGPDEPATIAEAPQFWDVSGKEEFTKLPPVAQKLVSKYEKERTADYHRRRDELSVKQREYAEKVGNFVTEAEQQLAYYENVDWVRASQEMDPKFVLQQKTAYEELQKSVRAAKQEQLRTERDSLVEHTKARGAQLVQLIPELADRKTSKAHSEKLVKYMKDENGIDSDAIAWAPAEAFVIADKAMKYDQLMAKAKSKRSADDLPRKPAGKTVKPRSSGGSSRNTGRLAALSKKSELSMSEAKELMRLKRAASKKRA